MHISNTAPHPNTNSNNPITLYSAMEGICSLFRATAQVQKTIVVTEWTASKSPLFTLANGITMDPNTGIGFKGNEVMYVTRSSEAYKSGVKIGDSLHAIDVAKINSGNSTGNSISFFNYLEFRKLIVAKSSTPSTPSDSSPTEPLGPHPNTSPNNSEGRSEENTTIPSSHSWSTSENEAASTPPSNSANPLIVEIGTHKLRFIGADLPSIKADSTLSLNSYNRVIEPITIKGYTIEVDDLVKISSTMDGRVIYDVIKPSHPLYYSKVSPDTQFGLTLKEVGKNQYMIENITEGSKAHLMKCFKCGDVVAMCNQSNGIRLIITNPVAHSSGVNPSIPANSIGFMTGLPEGTLYDTWTDPTF